MVHNLFINGIWIWAQILVQQIIGNLPRNSYSVLFCFACAQFSDVQFKNKNKKLNFGLSVISIKSMECFCDVFIFGKNLFAVDLFKNKKTNRSKYIAEKHSQYKFTHCILPLFAYKFSHSDLLNQVSVCGAEEGLDQKRQNHIHANTALV